MLDAEQTKRNAPNNGYANASQRDTGREQKERMQLRREIGAGNETRTRDPSLGKARIMLYQLDVAINVLKYWIRELRREIGAGNETRTRDPDLGKVVLYQLSYSRIGLD